MQRTNFLIPGPNDIGQTRIDRGVLGARASRMQEAGILATGPVTTTEMPFRLEANVPQFISATNPNRIGLMLQNKDPTNNLFYSFGSEATADSTFLAPGVVLLLDFICPTDQISVFAQVALSGHYRQFGRAA